MNAVGKSMRALGLILILLIILLYLPLTIPKLMGYELHSIISGSMEPEIPVGSLIYSKPVEAQSLAVDDIIVFRNENFELVTHRIVELHDDEIITKGDANQSADLFPITTGQVMGRVEYHMPVLGTVSEWLSTGMGKISVLCLLAAAILIRIAGGRMCAATRKEAEQQ